MDKKRKVYAPFSLTSEAGVAQTPVEGYIDVNQTIYPTVNTGTVNENGTWAGVKSNDTEFVREGLREEKQKLKSLRSKQKKIVKAKYAGIVTNLKQLEGQFVKRGNVILRISRKGGPPRIGLVEANASKIQKGTVLDVKSKSGERHQVTVLRKEIVSGKAILTLDLGSKKIKIAAVRITSRP